MFVDDVLLAVEAVGAAVVGRRRVLAGLGHADVVEREVREHRTRGGTRRSPARPTNRRAPRIAAGDIACASPAMKSSNGDGSKAVLTSRRSYAAIALPKLA